MQIGEQLYLAFKNGNLARIKAIFQEQPKLKHIEGRDWLHSMAPYTSIEVMRYLVSIGFDLHVVDPREGENALCSAAREAHADMVEFLLKEGVKIDTSLSVRNPLFAAVVAASGLLGSGIDRSGNPERVIELLFDHGIDASIEYKSPTMNRLNAAGFAICRDVPDIADLIVKLQSQGNSKAYIEFMKKAKKAARRQRFPSPYRNWVEVV